MMYIRYAFLALMVAAFVTVALANRDMTTLALLPDTMAALFGFNMSITLPLFIVIGLSVVLGLLLGFVWEWLRERSYRADAVRARSECDALRNELGRVRKAAPETQKDDVLAIVEAGERKARSTSVPAVAAR